MKIQKKVLNNSGVTLITFGSTLNNNELTGSIELDIENQQQFIEYINSVLDNNEFNIILSMENISYIDSSGLWALFECHKKTEQRNGKIVLLKPKKDVKRVLDITKISSKIIVMETEKKAVQHFKNHELQAK